MELTCTASALLRLERRDLLSLCKYTILKIYNRTGILSKIIGVLSGESAGKAMPAHCLFNQVIAMLSAALSARSSGSPQD
jgi:hypothetical protein